MTAEQLQKIGEVWREVSGWPAPARLSLASRIIQSLERQQAAPAQSTATDLIGVWKTDQPPRDEDVDRILEEEKMRKLG